MLPLLTGLALQAEQPRLIVPERKPLIGAPALILPDRRPVVPADEIAAMLPFTNAMLMKGASAAPAFDPATLFTGGEIGDFWRFDNVHTDQATVGGDISAATGLVNGMVLGFADAANKPKLQQPSGNYAARFDGSGDRLFVNLGSTVSQPGTIILCVNDSTFSSHVLACGSSSTLRWQISGDSSNNIIGYAGASLDSTINAPMGLRVLTFMVNGASSRIRANGTQTASGNAGTQSTNRFTVGATETGTFGATMDLYSALFIRRATELTLTEVDGVERLMGSHATLSW